MNEDEERPQASAFGKCERESGMKRINFDILAERVRNWGRWGDDDSRGTLNHINPEVLMRAVGSARQGKMFSLGMRFDRKGPQGVHSGRINPQLYMNVMDQAFSARYPSARYNDDVVHMSLQSATQWDALSHVHYDGTLYNGCKAQHALTSTGTKCLGVEHLASPGIMSRGVLLDIARLHGVAMLPGDHAIGPDELDQAAQAAGVTIEPGDIVLVRTGHMRRFSVLHDVEAFNTNFPGLSAQCVEWLYEHSLAAVCCDNAAVEHLGPDTLDDEMCLPLHMLCLRDMGMPLGELFDLEALAEDCAADGQHSFLLCAPPLGFTGAVGSPVNPTVLK
jgi:kynurenine formamidase